MYPPIAAIAAIAGVGTMTVLRWSTLVLLGFTAGWWLRGALPTADSQMPHVAPVPAEPAAVETVSAVEPWAQFEGYLASEDWDAAVAYYVGIERRGDPQVAATMRERILSAPRMASGRRDLAGALALLERYTVQNHRDTEGHYRLAEAAERLGQSRVALAALLDALDVELSGPDPGPARERVAALVDDLVAGRLAIGDRGAAMQLYESVLDRDPLNHRYRFLLAAQLEAAGEYRAAARTLEQIPAGGYDRVAVAELERRIQEGEALATRFSEGLPLTRSGGHFVVSATLDDGRALRLLLDTGATRSVIKPRVAAATLGAERLPQRIRIGTANGVVSASRYRLPGLLLGPFRIDSPELVVLDLEGLTDVDGLLGLDLLGQFDYRIDPSSGRLLLAR